MDTTDANVLLEFSIYPLDKGASLSPYVARCLDVIDRSGLDYRSHSMGTVVEGTFDQVMTVLRDCFEVLGEDCDRIVCNMKADYRRGRSGRLTSKLESVEAKLGRPVKT